MTTAPIEQALKDLRAGKMIVVVDDEEFGRTRPGAGQLAQRGLTGCRDPLADSAEHVGQCRVACDEENVHVT